MSVFEKMTAIADNIRSLLGLTEKLGLDAMTENLETANTEVESQKNIIEQLRSVISEKAGKPLGGSIDDLIDGSITEVTSDAETIVYMAFSERSLLTKAVFPNAKSLSGKAFENCKSLAEVDFPELTEVIGKYKYNVFSGCEKLKTVNLPKLLALEENMFSTCYALEEVVFPELTSCNGNGGFTNCRNLKTVDFPKLTSVANTNNLFNKCYSLRAVILRGETLCPMTGSGWFTNCHHMLGTLDATYNPNQLKDGYVYVRRTLYEEYTNSTNWVASGVDFRILEDYTVDGTVTGELDESKI